MKCGWFLYKGGQNLKNVDKSGKIVDNRSKLCKSAFGNFLPVLSELQVISDIVTSMDSRDISAGYIIMR